MGPEQVRGEPGARLLIWADPHGLLYGAGGSDCPRKWLLGVFPHLQGPPKPGTWSPLSQPFSGPHSAGLSPPRPPRAAQHSCSEGTPAGNRRWRGVPTCGGRGPGAAPSALQPLTALGSRHPHTPVLSARMPPLVLLHGRAEAVCSL